MKALVGAFNFTNESSAALIFSVLPADDGDPLPRPSHKHRYDRSGSEHTGCSFETLAYRVFMFIIHPFCRLCVHCGGHNNREIHHHQADYKGCSNYSFMRSCCLRRRIVRSAIVNGTTRLGPTGSCNIKGFLLMTLGEGLKKVEIPT